MTSSTMFQIESREMTDDGELIVVNFGPQHPATHGTLRIVFYLDGEKIIKADPDLGYLHTGFEKLAESMTFTQWIVTTDRMNYFSAFLNNTGFAVAVEELLDIEVPRRAEFIRVILGELSRISEHLVTVGLMAMDCGAFTPMLWSFKERERVYDIFDAVCGSRLTTSYTRIGGLFRDPPEVFIPMVKDFLKTFPETYDDMVKLLHKNTIFYNRLRGVGVLTKEMAMDFAVCGPILRASGVEMDARRARPYSIYDELDFDVPYLEEGDSFARYWVRMLEIQESLKIIEQCLEKMPAKGPTANEDFKYGLPTKDKVYNDMESLIHHFKQIMPSHNHVPSRTDELYSCTETCTGELGFYIVGDGNSIPYRTRIHPPCLKNYQIYPEIVKGHLISDAVPLLASLWVIAGELDR